MTDANPLAEAAQLNRSAPAFAPGSVGAMPDEEPIRIEREDGEALVIRKPLVLARAFFTGDPSSVGQGSFDELAGGGQAATIVLDDIKTVNRTMRARSPHANWAEIINGGFDWLEAIPEDLDLLELNAAAWEAADGDALLDGGLTAVLGKGRGLSVATKVLHLKRPRLFPVLDRLVAEMLGVNVPASPKPEPRQAIGRQLVRAVRREGRRNVEVLKAVQKELNDEHGIERHLVRILDAVLWFSHPAAGVGDQPRTIEVSLQTH